jgi:hypothetical protein
MFFPQSLKLLYLKSQTFHKDRYTSQNWISYLVCYHAASPSVPAEDCLEPFYYQRRRDT